MPATESANAPSRSRLCLAVWCTPGFLRLVGIWANHLTFFHVELGVDGFHSDGLFLLAQLKVWIHCGDAAGRHHRFDRVAPEARRFHAHFIGAGSQRRHAVLAALIAE